MAPEQLAINMKAKLNHFQTQGNFKIQLYVFIWRRKQQCRKHWMQERMVPGLANKPYIVRISNGVQEY